jgi:hypothetical protein
VHRSLEAVEDEAQAVLELVAVAVSRLEDVLGGQLDEGLASLIDDDRIVPVIERAFTTSGYLSRGTDCRFSWTQSLDPGRRPSSRVSGTLPT